MAQANDDCPICIETYTATTRKEIICPYCNYKTCLKCMKQHILNQQNPNCMNCHIEFNREFIDLNMTKNFRTKELKHHRENVLLEREKSLLPATVVFAEQEQHARKNENECSEMEAQIIELQNTINNIKEGIVTKRINIERLRRGEAGIASTSQDKHEKRSFIKPCVVTGCRGYLSTQYKCGICETWVCPHCHEVKEGQKDENHTCNPETVESIKLIAKETKPCPKCGVVISKIDGCFAKDTPILLWNGKTKMSQDISIGDVLVGDDGLPRNVLATTTDEDMLYEVSQNKGDNYVVNSKHTLVLKMTGDRKIHWDNTLSCWILTWFNQEEKKVTTKKEYPLENETRQDALKRLEDFKNNISYPREIEITVDDYMKLNERAKKALKGYKAPYIDWKKQETEIEPYMFGIWIGDGINNGMEFASNDFEILDYLVHWCENNSAELVHDGPYKFRVRRKLNTNTRLAIGHGCTSTTCKGCLISGKPSPICDIPEILYTQEAKTLDKNPLKEKLEYYNVIRNKHIPLQFVVNDRQSRIQFLAGIIDTDGCCTNEGKRINIRQTNKNIVEKIVIIARSVGYFVNVSKYPERDVVIKGVRSKGKESYSINISSPNLSELPTHIAYKACCNAIPNKDNYLTAVTVKPIGKGEYFGWAVDGNRRFLLPDMTVVRNCSQMWCVECHTTFDWTTGRETLTKNIHNPHYYEWVRRNNNGVVPRNPNDVPHNPCGNNRLPYVGSITSKYPDDNTTKRIIRLLRCLTHIYDYEILRNRVNNGNDVEVANRDLRVKYLLNEITDDDWKKQLQQREKKREISIAKQQVCQMIVDVAGQYMTQLAGRRLHIKTVLTIEKDLEKIVDYYNESMQKVLDRFNSKAKGLIINSVTWDFK
jgi:DNA-binding protein H-NS